MPVWRSDKPGDRWTSGSPRRRSDIRAEYCTWLSSSQYSTLLLLCGP